MPVPRQPISRRRALGLGVVAVTAACSSSSTKRSTGAAAQPDPSRSYAAPSAPSPSAPSPSAPSPSAPSPSAPSPSEAPPADGSPGTRRRVSYGSDPSQYGELYLPAGRRRPGLIVVIHGGFWSAEYTSSLGAPLAVDLARRGWAAWNLEYRRLGDGGGWPATFDDVAAGIDVLASSTFARDALDLTHVVAVGHSAGGQLAVWAAARPGLPVSAPGATPKVRVRGVVSQAGVLDLVRADQTSLGGTAVRDLLGGSATAVPARYDLASPVALVPIGVPVRCVHSPNDGIVPMEQSQRYVDAATAAGDDATIVRTTGDHFALITVGSPAWTATVDQLPGLVA